MASCRQRPSSPELHANLKFLENTKTKRKPHRPTQVSFCWSVQGWAQELSSGVITQAGVPGSSFPGADVVSPWHLVAGVSRWGQICNPMVGAVLFALPNSFACPPPWLGYHWGSRAQLYSNLLLQCLVCGWLFPFADEEKPIVSASLCTNEILALSVP